MKGCAKAAEVLRCTPSQGHSWWLAGVARDAASELPLGEKIREKSCFLGFGCLVTSHPAPWKLKSPIPLGRVAADRAAEKAPAKPHSKAPLREVRPVGGALPRPSASRGRKKI